jgi:hypothetical protein
MKTVLLMSDYLPTLRTLRNTWSEKVKGDQPGARLADTRPQGRQQGAKRRASGLAVCRSWRACWARSSSTTSSAAQVRRSGRGSGPSGAWVATGASRATLAGKVQSDFLKTTILIFFSGECGGAAEICLKGIL